MTFYKFAERQASTQVNWAELSKNMSDTFLEEQRLREEKKAAIDKETSDYATTLEQQPLSENVSMKEFWLKASEDLREAKLMSTRLLKEGKMRLTDYTVFSQNLQDGTNNFIDAMKRYNEEYKIKRERLMSQDPANASQLLEAWEMEQLQGLTDLANTKVYIDPTTGAMTMAKMTKKVVDGKEVMTMSDERVSANQIMNMLGSKYNKFDLNGALAQEEKMLGKYTDVLTQALSTGVSITEYENPARRGELDADLAESLNDFYSYRDNMVESYMSNPLNVSSILTDFTNKGYSFTDDPNDKDPMKILVKKTSSGLAPIFEGDKGEEQLKVASDYVKNKFMNMVDVVEKSKGVSKPASAGRQRQPTPSQIATARLADDFYKRLAALRTGTATEQNQAVQFLQAQDPNLFIRRTGDGVTVSYGNNTTQRTFKFSDYADEATFVNNIYTALVPRNYWPALTTSIQNRGNTPIKVSEGTAGSQTDVRPINQKAVDELMSAVKYYTADGRTRKYNTKADFAKAINSSLSWALNENEKMVVRVEPTNDYGTVKLVNAAGNQIGEQVYKLASDDLQEGEREYNNLMDAIAGYIGSLPSDKQTRLNSQYDQSPNKKYNTPK